MEEENFVKSNKPVTNDEIKSLKSKYQKVCRRYHYELKPSLILLKTLAYPGKIPLAYYLEIRALATHLIRAREIFDLSLEQIGRERFNKAVKNVDKADDHCKRCMLDSSKWVCVHFDDRARYKFARLATEVPLVRVNDGEYLKGLYERQREADKKYHEAKQLDAKGDPESNGKYDDAAEALKELYKYLDSPDEDDRETITELRQKEAKTKVRIYRKAIVGIGVAIFGLIISFL